MAEGAALPFQKDFVICVPSVGDPSAASEKYVADLHELFRAKKYRFEVLDFPASNPCDALTESLRRHRARYYVLIDLHQRLDLPFFSEALEKCALNFEIVRANRRSSLSFFRSPVRWLPYIFSRHHLSLLANRMIQPLTVLKGADPSSLNLFIRRETLERYLVLRHAHKKLFAYEFSHLAAREGWTLFEVPCRLFVSWEKTFLEVLRESLALVAALPSFFIPALLKRYQVFELKHFITSDDWGISRGVNEGILLLAERGIVSRVSVMSTEPHLKHRLEALKKLSGLQWGLHFNLTYGHQQKFGPGSPMAFIWRWLHPFRDKKELREEVRAELRRQIQLAKDAGISLKYIDGHHHIHMVPGLLHHIADILVEEKIEIVRYPYNRRQFFNPAKAFLNILSMMARPTFLRWKFQSFPVFYPDLSDFKDLARLKARLAKYPLHEIIVHPALFDDVQDDTYTVQRILEYKRLSELLPK